MRALNDDGGFSWNERDWRQDLQCLTGLIRNHFVICNRERLHLIALFVIGAGIHWNALDFTAQSPLSLLLLVGLLRFFLDFLLPGAPLPLGLVEIHEILGNFFPVTSLCAVKTDPVSKHLVFTDEVVIAILQVKLEGIAEQQQSGDEEKNYKPHQGHFSERQLN